MTKALAFAKAAAVWILWYLTPLHQTMLTIAVLVAADFVSGVWAAMREGQPFRSKELRRSIRKLIGYEAVVILSLLVEPYIDVPVVKVVSGFIALTEFQSAVENFSKITGVDIWGAVRSKLQPGKK